MDNIKDKKIPNVPNLRFRNNICKFQKVMIKEIADVIGGGTPKTEKDEYWNGNIQWFTPTEVGQNKYVSKSIKTYQSRIRKSSAKLLLKERYY